MYNLGIMSAKQKSSSLWWIYALILIALVCVIAVFGTIFANMAMFGLTGGPAYSTTVIVTATVAGLLTAVVAWIFRKHLLGEGAWVAGAAIPLWVVIDIFLYGAYMLPMPYTTITCIAAWVVFALAYRSKKSGYFAISVTVLAICACFCLFLLIDKFGAPLYYDYFNQESAQTVPVLCEESGNNGVDIIFVNPR